MASNVRNINNAEQEYTNNPDPILTVSRQFSKNKNFELLDDPIALMKKLKQERGIKAY